MRRVRQEELLARCGWYGAMAGAVAAMSLEIRAALEEWESKGNRTSTWPGWESIIGPKPDFISTPAAKVRVPKIRKQSVPIEMRWLVWERDNFTCKHCGSRTFLSVDHILAESKGGKTEPDNLQTLCCLCNSKKGAN